MADPKKVKVFDGTDWVDIKPDDPNLPISSSDNKVTLSDNGNGKFQIETGDPTASPSSKAVRVEVDDTTVTNRVDQILQINKNATTAPANASNVNNNQMMTLKSTDEAGAKFIGLSFQHVLSDSKGASACIGLQDESADGVPNKGEMQFVIRGDNSAQVTTPLKINKDAIIVDGQVQTDTITTKAAAVGDAKILLRGPITDIYANDVHSFQVLEKKAVANFQFIGGGAVHQYAAAPDYAFAGANDSGMFVAGTTGNHDVCFSTNAVERLRISANDIKAQDGYEPQTDDSLVTKGWVQTNGGDGTLPIASTDGTVTIDGEGNKVSVYGDSGILDITPVVLEIKTTANGSGWSLDDPWGVLSFWNDDASANGAKQHAFIDCVASTNTGGQSNMRFGTIQNVWMTMKASGLINFTPQAGNGNAAAEGDIFYDSRYSLFRYWDGEQWQDINPQGSGNGYFWNSRGEAACPGAGISEESPVIPVNIGTKYSSNDYMLNDGAIYTITLGTSSTGSVASSKYVVRKVDGVFTAEIMSSNIQTSNVPIISVRPTTQIDPDTGQPYVDRHEVVLWDNHAGNYTHTWNIEGMITGSVQQQFSVNNPWYTIGTSIYQNDNTSYVCLDAINSKQQAIQDVAWSYSSGSFVGKWADPEETAGSNTRVTFNTWNSNAANAMYPRPDGQYGRWYERPRVGMRLTNANTNTKFESATNAYDGNFYSFNGDPATWQGGLIQAVEWDGNGTNVENVTKIRMSARDKNEKDMCHSRTYVSPQYLEDSQNVSGNDWMQIWITQDDDSKLAAAYMVTSGQYVSPSAGDPIDSQPYYEYGVEWYGSGTSIGTDFNGGKAGEAYQIQFFRNMTGMVISENGNTQLTRLSVDFNHADGQFYRDATARLAAERVGGTAQVTLCGYSQINATIGLHKNFECGYYGFKIFAAQKQVADINGTAANFAGSVTASTILVTTDSSTCAVFESTTQSAQVKCISTSGTTWHGIANGKWAVDYYPTGTSTYTEGLRLDLDDGRVTSKGGIGTDTITTKNGAANDVITYLANDELRVNTAIEKPSAPGTYGRSNTFTVEPNAVKVLSNINTGDAALASADLVIGYDSTVGSTTPFGLLQWQAWDNTSDKNMISFCEIGIDPVDGAGRGNGGELVFKTKEANIDGTTERLRITKNDIKAQAGYEPQTDDSLATKKYVDSRIWKGTQSEYDALSSYDDNILYCITG